MNVLNFMIQFLKGWSNPTCKSLSQITSFDLYSCLLRSIVHMNMHSQEFFEVTCLIMVFIKKGKNVSWLEVVVMIYLSTNRKDLQFHVQDIQALIFYIAHFLIFFNYSYLCVYKLEAITVATL